jgi:hypothetical protein
VSTIGLMRERLEMAEYDIMVARDLLPANHPLQHDYASLLSLLDVVRDRTVRSESIYKMPVCSRSFDVVSG